MVHTLWAACNIGAYNQEDFGNYYAWGEITTKENYNWETYIYAEGTTNDDPRLIKYCNSYEYGNNYTDNLIVLETSDDVANTIWGANWRMPTYSEFSELKSYCTAVWTTQNGVKGYLFTGTNGNSIFLPAAGFCSSYVNSQVNQRGSYLTSTISESGSGAKGLSFSDASNTIIGLDRYMGFSIRAVCNFNPKRSLENNNP
ncbi:MAG: hypothetical protein IKP45_13505 [Bacteroidales bacterium]|nr:hypothetical protein [Bacteroidales bacterium]